MTRFIVCVIMYKGESPAKDRRRGMIAINLHYVQGGVEKVWLSKKTKRGFFVVNKHHRSLGKGRSMALVCSMTSKKHTITSAQNVDRG